MKEKKVTCGSANLQRRRGEGWVGEGGVGGRGEVGFDVSPGWRRALIAKGGKRGERMGWCGCRGVWMSRGWPELDYSNTSTFSEESGGRASCSHAVDKLGEMC